MGLYTATFFVCLASGFVPFLNAELYVASVSAVSEGGFDLPLVLASTLGQMTAKTALFLTGKGVLQLPIARNSARTQKVLARMEAWKGRSGLLVFVSASTGIPPFYIVSLLGGVMHLSLARFLVCGFAGRFLRFGFVAAGPQAVRALFA